MCLTVHVISWHPKALFLALYFCRSDICIGRKIATVEDCWINNVLVVNVENHDQSFSDIAVDASCLMN